MTVFLNKNLIKALLEKKIKEEKMEESFGIGKKNLILVSVADTETRFQSYTKWGVIISE